MWICCLITKQAHSKLVFDDSWIDYDESRTHMFGPNLRKIEVEVVKMRMF